MEEGVSHVRDDEKTSDGCDAKEGERMTTEVTGVNECLKKTLVEGHRLGIYC
jgi:hypothetical protein